MCIFNRKIAALFVIIIVVLGNYLRLDAAALPIEKLYLISSDFCEASYLQQHADQLKFARDGWKDLQRVTWDANLTDIKQEIMNSNSFRLDAEFDENTPGLIKYDPEKLYPRQHYGFVVASKEIEGQIVYVICFRGTVDNYTVMLTDFMAWPTEFLNTGIYVHSGFEWYRRACSKNKVFKKFLDRIEKETNPHIVLVTGHSLGAGTAILESAYLAEKKITNTKQELYLIPLAQPCAGRPDFVNRYKNSFKEYSWFGNNLDPALVYTGLIGYSHFGKLIPFSLGPVDKVVKRHDLELYREYIEKTFKE